VSCSCVFKFAQEMARWLATTPCFSIVIGSAECISEYICVVHRHFKNKTGRQTHTCLEKRRSNQSPRIEVKTRTSALACCAYAHIRRWQFSYYDAIHSPPRPHPHTHVCADNCNDPNKLIYGYDSMSCMCGKDCSATGGPDNTGGLIFNEPVFT